MDNKFKIFELDYHRHVLAKTGKGKELLETYSGNYPEEEISTIKKWDMLSRMDFVPTFRIERLKRVVKMINPQSKILDIGVGWGDIIPLLKEKNKEIDYTGIDFSKEIISKLKTKFPEHKFLCGTIEKINERFDMVLALEVMEHIVPSKTLNFLNQIKNILKDDGILIVTVPINENLIEHSFICNNCGKIVNKMGHVRIYSPELIKSELKLAGFEPCFSEYLYMGYYGIKGYFKRNIRDIAARLIGPFEYKKTKPECILIKCRKYNDERV